ncbi:hypothetical protein SLEP1_g49315 [Rubroshorea leprosula]|uniref:Uncharacterized protein n=1 Tax=Rubroshorea leprosula TaxID=152421 RepID=A0AAV5LZP2_9ROSI|nr:hypothetical protein SLEP1_g49315 [Rubroshorea leprosula]
MEITNNSSTEQRQSKKEKGGWRAIKYILANETFEKLASMSLIANLTVYLQTHYNLDGILLISVVSVWSGSCNVTPIIGALFSDTFLGRFRTLLFGSISSFSGMGIIAFTAAISALRPPTCIDKGNCIGPKEWQLGVLFIGLGLLAIGAGGIRPCNIAFGADQFDTTTKKGRRQLESFFNWWYFSFTLALVVALTGVVYIQTNVSWALGFFIPTMCLFFSIAIFIIGHHTYILAKPQGSVFVDMAKVIVAAFRKRGLRASEHTLHDPPPLENEVKIPHSERFRCLDKAAMVVDESEVDEQGLPKNGWKLTSVRQVEHLKMLLGMLPIWITGIGCFIAMDQQNSIGIMQVIQSNKKLGSHFQVPPAWMGLSSMIALAIWIFIYEQIWVPQARKLTGKTKRLTMTHRLNIGIVIAIVCALVAATVETKRRGAALKSGTFESPLSVLFFLPQFALSGLIEAFAAVALMELLTTQLPESMRTVAGAIFFLSLSVSSYLNSLLVNIVYTTTKKSGKGPWLGGHDLNKDRLEYFYYLQAGIEVLNLIYFNAFARHFLAKNGGSKEEQRSEDKAVETA